MPNFTTRLGLTLPVEATEFYDVDIVNANNTALDAAVGATICTSGTRPSTPYPGQIIYETDTEKILFRIGAAWVEYEPPAGVTVVANTAARNALAATEGMLVYRQDANAHEYYDGAAWRPYGMTSVADVTERNALVSPLEGMTVFRRDKDWVEHFDTNWRVKNVAAVTSATDRDNNITHPYTGQVIYRTDTGLTYSYDGAVWLPQITLAGRILGQAGQVHANVGATEVNITKLAIENYKFTANHFYMFNWRIFLQEPTADNDFLIRIRKDTALTGGIMVETPFLPTVSSLDCCAMGSAPYQEPFTDTDADVYISLVRVIGAGTIDIIGDGRSAFWIQDMGNDSTLWQKVN